MDSTDPFFQEAKSVLQEYFPKYTLVRHIGGGNFGQVYEVESQFQVRALKVVRMLVKRTKKYHVTEAMSSRMDDDLKAVKKYYQHIRGQGVVEVFDFDLMKYPLENDLRGLLLIMMEMCPHNLTSYILDEQPGERKLIRFMTELAQVLHRLCGGADPYLVTDLKPDNLLITSADRLVIGDLGGIKRQGSIAAGSSSQIDYDWLSPEGLQYGFKPTPAAVVFTYGLVSFFMWEQERPFGDEMDTLERLDKLRDEGPVFESKAPQPVQALITACLAHVPDQRPANFGSILEKLHALSSSAEAASQPPATKSKGTFKGFGAPSGVEKPAAEKTGAPIQAEPNVSPVESTSLSEQVEEVNIEKPAETRPVSVPPSDTIKPGRKGLVLGIVVLMVVLGIVAAFLLRDAPIREEPLPPREEPLPIREEPLPLREEPLPQTAALKAGHKQAFTFTEKGVTFNMVYIPAGEYLRGSPSNEPGRFDDETQHRVRISKGFWMGETEVTQALWQAVMENNPSYFTACGSTCPVEQVSWHASQEFIELLNGLVSGGGFRLPTEAEWEYAARAGTTGPFHMGNCLSTSQANYNGNSPLEGCPIGESRQTTVPAGSFAPNDWGLYDMHGNVSEWVQDEYGKYPSEFVTDPQGPSSNDPGASRVYRGGAWYFNARVCRSASRLRSGPDDRRSSLGLRLARTH